MKDLWGTKVMYCYVLKLLFLIPSRNSQIELRRPSIKKSVDYIACYNVVMIGSYSRPIKKDRPQGCFSFHLPLGWWQTFYQEKNIYFIYLLRNIHMLHQHKPAQNRKFILEMWLKIPLATTLWSAWLQY